MVLGAWAAQVQTAAGAEVGDHEAGLLAPVVITGSRSASATGRSTASIDVVDGETLREGQLQIHLSEGLRRVPGLVIRNRENHAQDLQVSVRGHGARSTFGVRGVRLFVDGIPASAPDGSGQAANFPLGSADRVEVVRGPFASLYGASSGGAILLYTQDGERPGEWRSGLAAGADGLWRLSSQWRGQTGGGTGPGWSYTLDAGKFATEGIRAHAGAHRSTVNAKFSRAHEGGRTVLVFNRQSAYALDPLGLTREDFDQNPYQVSSVATAFNTRKSVSQTQAGVAWEQALGAGHKLELMAYGGRREVLQYQAIPPAAQNAPGSSGGVIDLGRDYGGWNARWRLVRHLQSGQVDVSAGLAADRQADERRGYHNFTGLSSAPTALGVRGQLRRDETNRADTLDPYLRAEWATDDWTLTGGLRRVRARYDAIDQFLSNGDDSGGARFGATLPVLGLRVAILPSLQAHASVGRGFEIPTLNEAAYRSDGLGGLNTELNAARSTSREMGLRGRQGNGWWTATLFEVHTQDEIVVLRNTGGRAVFQNAGRTARQGLELSAEHGWGPLVLSVAHTRLRARYRDSFLTCVGVCSAPSTPVARGNRMPGLPHLQSWGQLAWTPAWAAPVGGVFTLEAQHTGRVFVNDTNTDSADGHTLLGMGARFEQRAGHWTWREFVRLDNATNRRHAGSVIVNDGNGRFFEPGAGRSLSVGVEGSRRF
jgi:iron complex outermembrane receptor protein